MLDPDLVCVSLCYLVWSVLACFGLFHPGCVLFECCFISGSVLCQVLRCCVTDLTRAVMMSMWSMYACTDSLQCRRLTRSTDPPFVSCSFLK